MDTLIAQREHHKDLVQSQDWSDARARVLQNVMEVCRTVCPSVLEVGSAARGTDLPYSDIDLVCLFDEESRSPHRGRVVEQALRKLSASIDRRDDYFDDCEQGFPVEEYVLDGKWVVNGQIHVIKGGNIRWHTGEVTPFQRKGRSTVSGWQAYEGLNEACNVHICVWHKGRVLEAKLEGSSLIWPTETWLRKSSCEHIATKWPNPPPKPVQTMVKRVSELRFASDSISDHFADGRPLMNLVHDIMLKAIDPYVHPNMILDCVRLPHSNALYCLNNRRLWCLNRLEEIQNQEVVVRVKIYNFSDSPAFFQSRVTSVNGGFSVYIRKNTDDGLQDGLESIHISKSKRKAEYLHLTCDGYKVDILVSCTRSLSKKKLANALLQEHFGERHLWAAVCAAAHSKDLQCQSHQQKMAIKLAKLWTWYVAFPRWSVKVRPRSFLIEVMVRYVDSKKSCSSPWEIFVAFLQLCAGKKIEPIMWDWGCYNHDHRVNWGSGPRILDPVNPTNNVAKPFRCWGFLRKYARKSLEKIQQKEGPASHWASSEDETVPRLSPANPEEVRKVLLKMGLPQRSVEGLLAPDFGFTSLEVLCQLGKESDFVEVGMNKAQARLLCKALETGGYIFRKLESEGRQAEEDWVEIEARKLKMGDLVPCTGGLVKLESVDHRLMQVRVVELMVEPDDIFEAFHTPPMSFLCKGQAPKGGTKTPWNLRSLWLQRHKSQGAQDVPGKTGAMPRRLPSDLLVVRMRTCTALLVMWMRTSTAMWTHNGVGEAEGAIPVRESATLNEASLVWLSSSDIAVDAEEHPQASASAVFASYVGCASANFQAALDSISLFETCKAHHDEELELEVREEDPMPKAKELPSDHFSHGFPEMILATSKYLRMDDVLAFRASSKTLFENQTKEAEIHAATDLIHLFETGNDSEVIAVCECLVKRKKFIRSFRLHRAFRSWQVPLTSKKNMRRFKSQNSLLSEAMLPACRSALAACLAVFRFLCSCGRFSKPRWTGSESVDPLDIDGIPRRPQTLARPPSDVSSTKSAPVRVEPPANEPPASAIAATPHAAHHYSFPQRDVECGGELWNGSSGLALRR
eukprot:symbB.v1.2.031816.t1/scaffold3735.1/size51219/6